MAAYRYCGSEDGGEVYPITVTDGGQPRLVKRGEIVRGDFSQDDRFVVILDPAAAPPPPPADPDPVTDPVAEGQTQ